MYGIEENCSLLRDTKDSYLLVAWDSPLNTVIVYSKKS